MYPLAPLGERVRVRGYAGVTSQCASTSVLQPLSACLAEHLEPSRFTLADIGKGKPSAFIAACLGALCALSLLEQIESARVSRQAPRRRKLNNDFEMQKKLKRPSTSSRMRPMLHASNLPCQILWMTTDSDRTSYTITYGYKATNSRVPATRPGRPRLGMAAKLSPAVNNEIASSLAASSLNWLR